MLKGDRATPSLILLSTVQRSWNCKNILCGRECTHHPNRGFDGRTISSNISSRCPHNMVNFGLLAAEIGPVVWGTLQISTGFASWQRYCMAL